MSLTEVSYNFDLEDYRMSWWKRFSKSRAKAKLVLSTGNHIENLAVHPTVSIQQIDEIVELPVWIDIPAEGPTTSTYEGFLWEIEPMGEYLYFLAGNFLKNEKGLLRYESVRTMAEVHVCFEEDVVSVDRSEMQRWSEVADQEVTFSSDFIGMTVGEITSFAQNRSQDAGFTRHHAALDLEELRGGLGYMEQAADFRSGPWVRLLWSKHVKTSQGLRVTKIIVRSIDPNQDFSSLYNLLKSLINRYENIGDHPLSGAIRM